MSLPTKDDIRRSFSTQSTVYNNHAFVQKKMAEILSGFLPPLSAGDSILEIGCGTGFLTRHLVERYKNRHLHITDIAPAMVRQCQNRFSGYALDFSILDGEQVQERNRYSLITANLTFQWFLDFENTIKKLQSALKPKGVLLFSMLATDCFPQWQECLQRAGGNYRSPIYLADKVNAISPIYTADIKQNFAKPQHFLQDIKKIGASPRITTYYSVSVLRQALRTLQIVYNNEVTYKAHIFRVEKS